MTDIVKGYKKLIRDRAYMPHCDQSILHAPGKCEHCDKYPDLQHARKVMRIAFTNSPEERGNNNYVPCPSVWFRFPEHRDLWYGNVARPHD